MVPDFDFYVSAFISAARSVTWVMHAEYGRVSGWKEWYEQQNPSNEIREFLRKLNDLRVRSQKAVPISTRTTANVRIPPEAVTPGLIKWLADSKNRRVRLVPVDSSNEQFALTDGTEVVAIARLAEAQHEVPEFPGEHVAGVCRRYISLLEALAEECERRFPL